MSLNLFRDIQSTLREAERDNGKEHFTWKETQIPCLASSEGRETVIDSKGNAWDVLMKIRVRIQYLLTADSTIFSADSTLFTSDNEGKPVPVTGRTLVFRGRTYRVGPIDLAGSRTHYTLSLMDQNA